jgi:hypothetical protein
MAASIDANDKRLHKLAQAWEDTPGSGVMTWSLADLRLLLERFEPLREEIRRIAVGAGPHAALPAAPDAASPPARPSGTASLDASPPDAAAGDFAAGTAAPQHPPQSLQAELEAAQRRCAELERQLAMMRKDADEARRAAELAGRQAMMRVSAQRAWGKAGEALDILLREPELARRLGLDGLADDVDSLVRSVAVLAQRNGLDTLFAALAETADVREGASSLRQGLSIGLLAAALAWHNHGWRDRPFRLVEPRAGEAFDFHRHKRAASTPRGEIIERLLLPGMEDADGRMVFKCLVATR